MKKINERVDLEREQADWRKGTVIICAAIFLCIFLGCKPEPLKAPLEEPAKVTSVTMASYKELQDFFQTYGYTFETWRAGLRAVPRVYVSDMPEHWAEIADQVSLKTKKELFYSAILPIVLRANERIMVDRERAEPLAMQILAGVPIAEEDRVFISDLAAHYKVELSSDVYTDAAMIKEVLLRVDLVPPSLALAQAAFESAYGTSRFAGLGNALFGQERYDGEGIPALDNDKRKRPFEIAGFDSPLECTSAYMFNLNTHPAYLRFRKLRAEFRRNGKFPDGRDLALTLTKYSERGEIYAREVAHVIRNLRLTQADSAFLRNMKPLYIIPKKTPSNEN